MSQVQVEELPDDRFEADACGHLAVYMCKEVEKVDDEEAFDADAEDDEGEGESKKKKDTETICKMVDASEEPPR